jgi:hypothetical protein
MRCAREHGFRKSEAMTLIDQAKSRAGLCSLKELITEALRCCPKR